MTVSGYSRQRVLLHWMSAAVIAWALASGFYVASVEVTAQIRQWVTFINVSLTSVFIPFFIWRFFIFVYHALQVNVTALSIREALVLLAHALTYFTVSVVLLTGVLMMDRPIDVFGVVEIAQPLVNPELIAQLALIHVWACVVLSAQIALHVAAVIVHEARGDRILRQMSLRRCGSEGVR